MKIYKLYHIEVPNTHHILHDYIVKNGLVDIVKVIGNKYLTLELIKHDEFEQINYLTGIQRIVFNVLVKCFRDLESYHDDFLLRLNCFYKYIPELLETFRIITYKKGYILNIRGTVDIRQYIMDQQDMFNISIGLEIIMDIIDSDKRNEELVETAKSQFSKYLKVNNIDTLKLDHQIKEVIWEP